MLKATLVFIFGPNLMTKTLLRPRPKLNNITCQQKGSYTLDLIENQGSILFYYETWDVKKHHEQKLLLRNQKCMVGCFHEKVRHYISH